MKSLRRAVPSFFLLASFSILLVTPRPTFAQDNAAQSPASASTADQPGTSGKSAEATSEATAKPAAAEAEAQDETAKFKHSAAVKFLSRVTGLSLDAAYWLAVLINFAIVAGAIGWALRKQLPGAFRGRTEGIQKAMQEARLASEEANRRLADVEARLAKLGAEINQMQASAEKDALAEEARIVAAAEDDKRKIVDAAGQEIAAAAKQAQRELKAFAANLAVDLAQKQIHVDAATDQNLVRDFAGHLAQSGTGEEKN